MQMVLYQNDVLVILTLFDALLKSREREILVKSSHACLCICVCFSARYLKKKKKTLNKILI